MSLLTRKIELVASYARRFIGPLKQMKSDVEREMTRYSASHERVQRARFERTLREIDARIDELESGMEEEEARKKIRVATVADSRQHERAICAAIRAARNVESMPSFDPRAGTMGVDRDAMRLGSAHVSGRDRGTSPSRLLAPERDGSFLIGSSRPGGPDLPDFLCRHDEEEDERGEDDEEKEKEDDEPDDAVSDAVKLRFAAEIERTRISTVVGVMSSIACIPSTGGIGSSATVVPVTVVEPDVCGFCGSRLPGSEFEQVKTCSVCKHTVSSFDALVPRTMRNVIAEKRASTSSKGHSTERLNADQGRGSASVSHEELRAIARELWEQGARKNEDITPDKVKQAVRTLGLTKAVRKSVHIAGLLSGVNNPTLGPAELAKFYTFMDIFQRLQPFVHVDGSDTSGMKTHLNRVVMQMIGRDDIAAQYQVDGVLPESKPTAIENLRRNNYLVRETCRLAGLSCPELPVPYGDE